MKTQFALIVLTLVTLLLGCGAEPSKQTINRPLPSSIGKSSIPTQTALKRMLVNPLRPVSFDFDQLMLGSDLIIEGRIESVVETRNLGSEDVPQIQTDFSVQLTTVLKSEAGFQADSIVVSQSGGIWNGLTQIIEDDKPFQVGEQVLLFLTKGEDKYGVMIPGGRFKIDNNGILASSSKDLNLEIVKKFDGKSKTVIEEAILNSLPDAVDYLGALFPAFLIAEGTVNQIGTRIQKGEDTQLVYTDYAFTVSRVLYDDIDATKDSFFRDGKYLKTPIKKGDVITVLEFGGTYKGITQPPLSPNPMPSGSEVLLFLGGFTCEERPGVCTQEEQKSGYAVYITKDPGRFILESEKKLKVLAPRGWIKRLYDGQEKSKLEKDLLKVKERWKAKENSIQTVPDSTTNYPLPPDPTSTP